ncbi:MAG: MbcA/ParS/Xre antitoxin family protein [Moheibacter sp.]
METKKYKRIESELPCVNEPSGMYMYLSQTQNRFIQILDELIGLSDEIISKWLNITTRTYRNYKTKDTEIKENTKEHIVSILSLYKHGMEVFSTKDEFENWLTLPNPFLDNKAPMDFMDTISGIQLIDNRLTAMEFGENV